MHRRQYRLQNYTANQVLQRHLLFKDFIQNITPMSYPRGSNTTSEQFILYPYYVIMIHELYYNRFIYN